MRNHSMHGSILAIIVGAMSLAVGLSPVSAQDYPNRPIRMLVGFSPGSGTDLLARVFAEPLSKALGQPVVVENRSGANSALGTRLVAQSAPDGYTLLFMASSMASNIHGMKDPGYKMSDFVPIGGLAESPFAMMVSTKSLPVKSLKEVIEIGKKSPDKLTYGSLGPASTNNLAASRLAKAAGFKWREIPYKSGGEANLAIISGTIDSFFAAPATAIPIVNEPSNGVIVAAVSSKQRNPRLPDVPTFLELGYDVQDGFSYGIFAVAGTPQPVLDKLRSAFLTVRAMDDTKKRIETAGLNLYQGDYNQYFADIVAQSNMFENDFKELGIEKE